MMANMLTLTAVPTVAPANGRRPDRQRRDIAEGGADSGTDSGPGPQRRRFGSRWRHLLVAGLKFVLPAIAAVTLLLVVAWPTFWPGVERLRLGSTIPVVDLAEGSDAMLDTTYRSVDKKGRPFVVHADVVSNVANENEPMALATPKGELTLDDGGEVTLEARDGLYDRSNEKVDLKGDVTLIHPSGYEVRSSAAHIDLPTGDASGNEAVTASGPLGTIKAEGFSITDDGRVINFTGRSRMVITPEPKSSP